MYVDDGTSGTFGKSPDSDQILKQCTKCGVDKPLSAYGKQPGGRLGLHPRCKGCRQTQERARYEANRDEILTRQKAARPRKRITERGGRRQLRSVSTSGEKPRLKRCTKCGVEKPLSAYGKQKGGRYGLHPRCKECRQAQERARYEENREEILARQKAARPRKRIAERRRRRKLQYGMTPEHYETLYENQEGCCAICGERLEVLCVDHDHHTNEVRGLLCNPCNVGLGFLRDDPQRLLAAVEYLRDPPARQVARISHSANGAMAEPG